MVMLNQINSLIIYIDIIFSVLISVAFLTLLERKILGYIQIRKGPNKVGMMGLLQPFSDAIKLFTKESMVILKSNYMLYMISPLLMMILMLLLWMYLPVMSNMIEMDYSFMMILCLMSLGVYFIMMAGWASNSMYSLIGCLRSVAQTISYEVSMILIMMSIILLIESFNILELMYLQKYVWFIVFNMPISLILFVSLLAELNRTPFDFAEGESELVSGFNTEYMSGSFAMIFIAEYGMILFSMYLYSMFFFGANIFSIKFYVMYLLMIFMVIWVRGTYPRFRYDNLMMLTWKSYLPVSLNYIIFILGLKSVLNY